jgi:hypothetical protein
MRHPVTWLMLGALAVVATAAPVAAAEGTIQASAAWQG